jgi:PAS domain S-box-containing protein
MLPDIDGIEVCRRIKSERALARTFVALLSGKRVDSDSQAAGLEGGADEYIPRPIPNRELLARVRAMLRIQRAEDLRRSQMRELRERVKELNCLYGISKLVEEADMSLPEILQGTVELIPPAWMFPESTCARIVINDRTYESEDFHVTLWKQERKIVARGEPVGRIEVYYREERPAEDEGPFLLVEGNLLDVIAGRLGRIVERVRAEDALQRERDLVARVMDTSPVGISVFDRHGRMTFANALLQQMASHTGVTSLIGRAYNDTAWESLTREGDPLPDEELPFAQVIACRDRVYSIEHDIRLADGPRLCLSSNAAPIFDESGHIDSVVVTTEDITQRRMAEAQIEEAAATAERERLARELHDAVTQSLFSVAAIAEAVPRVWERDPEEARSSLEELRWLTHGALAEMRAMLLELRPAALTEQKLGVLLRQLTDAMMGRTRMPVTTTVVGDCPLPADVQIALYRIAQEGLNNITKYARASEAKVSLRCTPGMVKLRISDDGRGFDPDAVQSHQMGLEIMRERAQDVGAALTIESRPGHGTRIEADWRASVAGEDDG